MRLSPESAHVCLESTLVSDSNLLSIKSLSVSFGGLKALADVNLDLHKNEVSRFNWAKWCRKNNFI